MIIEMCVRAGQCICFFFFFKQKTAYEIGTGDWSSDVCSSDLKQMSEFSWSCQTFACIPALHPTSYLASHLIVFY